MSQLVAEKDLQAVLKKYIVPLFDPMQSIAAVTTAPSKVEQMKEGYTRAGFTVHVLPTLDDMLTGI
jgi:hypothetical protein